MPAHTTSEVSEGPRCEETPCDCCGVFCNNEARWLICQMFVCDLHRASLEKSSGETAKPMGGTH